ncbi:hypothetical protein Pelo_7016 [Pelomyxa schiedti]|nr:hypothetical protein Pelo_7016 [Pelomyxa schiedti]
MPSSTSRPHKRRPSTLFTTITTTTTNNNALPNDRHQQQQQQELHQQQPQRHRQQQQQHHQIGGLVAVAPATRTTHTTTSAAGPHALTTVTTKVTTTTRKETARDQVAALCAGLHPRCGAACPLRRVMGAAAATAATSTATAIPVRCVGDAPALAVRLVWEWIAANSRFYCVIWDSDCGDEDAPYVPPLMVTFGVSMLLMTLTHDVRWWAQRYGMELLGSSLHYLIVEKGRGVFLLQDRQTGKRIQLVKFPDSNDYMSGTVRCATNGRWIVWCDGHSMKMVVAEIPMRKNGATTTVKRPTVVKIDPRWKICTPQFVGVINENHLLLCCRDSLYCIPTFFELVLVDLVETFSSKRLAVLSSTSFESFVSKKYHVFRKQHREGGGGSPNHLLFVMGQSEGVSRGYYHLITIEEGTGKLGRAFPESKRAARWRVSQVNQSQFCVMDDDSHFPVEGYSVWDVNNPGSTPVRKQQCLSGCTASQAFVEGGLLFQISKATSSRGRKEIHVTDEATGAHVITLELFRSLDSITSHFSFSLLSDSSSTL